MKDAVPVRRAQVLAAASVVLASLFVAETTGLRPAGATAPAVLAAKTADSPVGTSTSSPASGPRGLAGITKGADSLRLLTQTPWVGPGDDRFQITLAVTATEPASMDLAVDVYPALVSRSGFEAVLGGSFLGGPYYQNAVSLENLPEGSGGGVEVDLPVNSALGGSPTSSTGVYPVLPISGTAGVYPVEVFLEAQGVTEGKPLTTFLVYTAGGASSFKHLLNVALVVPISAKVPVSPDGRLGSVPTASARELEGDVAEIASHKVAVTVQASPSTLGPMAESRGEPKAAVSMLARSVADGVEVLPATSLPVNIGSLVNSGLGSELGEQLSAGAAELHSLLGVSPSLGTWAFSRRLDRVTLGALAAMGARHVVLPDGALSALPPQYQDLTFAQPADLALGTRQVEVVGAYNWLSQRVGQAQRSAQAVLVANQVLAELALVDLEKPNDVDQRGIVVMPAAGRAMSPSFLSVLLSGLQGNPLLRGVTLEQEFRDVPVAASSGSAPLVRQVVGPSTGRPLAGADELAAARDAVMAAAAVFGQGSKFVAGLDHRLFVSASSVFGSRQRDAIVTAVRRSAEVELHKLHLPPSIPITLTSRRGRLPVTLESNAGVPARVRLVLSSDQLSFGSYRSTAGLCTPLPPGAEECQLSLVHNIILQVPVTVRTSGGFQLSLVLETPGGTVVATSTATIRSTAVSNVGLLLMVGAALFLLFWWVRNARHGRRARKLVPPPDDSLVMVGLGDGPTA